MSTPTTADTPLDEMSHDELVAEVRRLRAELETANMPHPAMWANAQQAYGEAKAIGFYYDLPDRAKRAIELLGYLVDIRTWTPAS